MQVKRKLAKMVWSGSLAPGTLALAPRFVNNDYVTAEITYRLHVSHEVLTSHGLLCVVCLYELHHENPGYCWVGTTLEQHHSSATWVCVLAMLWLCYGCCYGCCINQERGSIMAAVPARREEMCLHFLRLLPSSSSLLACPLSTLGSANSVNKKIISAVRRISNTKGIISRMNSNTLTNQQIWLEI